MTAQEAGAQGFSALSVMIVGCKAEPECCSSSDLQKLSDDRKHTACFRSFSGGSTLRRARIALLRLRIEWRGHRGGARQGLEAALLICRHRRAGLQAPYGEADGEEADNGGEGGTGPAGRQGSSRRRPAAAQPSHPRNRSAPARRWLRCALRVRGGHWYGPRRAGTARRRFRRTPRRGSAVQSRRLRVRRSSPQRSAHRR